MVPGLTDEWPMSVEGGEKGLGAAGEESATIGAVEMNGTITAEAEAANAAPPIIRNG